MVRIKILCVILPLTFTAPLAVGQTTDQETTQVMQVVDRLFEGMKQGDIAMVRPLFHPEARLMTATEKDGKAKLSTAPISRFVEAVGSPHEKVWDEQIKDPIVRIDGRMATVWTPYRFYLGKAFSHCGVNAFQLFKSKQGWQIIQITDTRREGDCP